MLEEFHLGTVISSRSRQDRGGCKAAGGPVWQELFECLEMTGLEPQPRLWLGGGRGRGSERWGIPGRTEPGASLDVKAVNLEMDRQK